MDKWEIYKKYGYYPLDSKKSEYPHNKQSPFNTTHQANPIPNTNQMRNHPANNNPPQKKRGCCGQG